MKTQNWYSYLFLFGFIFISEMSYSQMKCSSFYESQPTRKLYDPDLTWDLKKALLSDFGNPTYVKGGAAWAFNSAAELIEKGADPNAFLGVVSNLGREKILTELGDITSLRFAYEWLDRLRGDNTHKAVISVYWFIKKALDAGANPYTMLRRTSPIGHSSEWAEYFGSGGYFNHISEAVMNHWDSLSQQQRDYFWNEYVEKYMPVEMKDYQQTIRANPKLSVLMNHPWLGFRLGFRPEVNFKNLFQTPSNYEGLPYMKNWIYKFPSAIHDGNPANLFLVKRNSSFESSEEFMSRLEYFLKPYANSKKYFRVDEKHHFFKDILDEDAMIYFESDPRKLSSIWKKIPHDLFDFEYITESQVNITNQNEFTWTLKSKVENNNPERYFWVCWICTSKLTLRFQKNESGRFVPVDGEFKINDRQSPFYKGVKFKVPSKYYLLQKYETWVDDFDGGFASDSNLRTGYYFVDHAALKIEDLPIFDK